MEQELFTKEDLQAIPLFKDLSLEDCESLCRDQRHGQMPTGHQLIVEGDWDDGVYLIREGMAKVRHFTLEGDEIVVAVIGAGSILGDMALLIGSGRRTADVVALAPVKVVKLRGSRMRQLLDQHTNFALAMATLQARRLSDLGRRFRCQQEDATTRVLATLLDLAYAVSGNRDPCSPIPSLPQREIATIAGLARGTASSIISKLRARGILIEDATTLQIADLEPLKKRGLID